MTIAGCLSGAKNAVRRSVLLCLAASLGCASAREFTVNASVLNAIALCSGGYSSSATDAFTVEVQERGGRFISEIAERGISAFNLAELEGRDAVEAYINNSYLQCINERQRERRDEERSMAVLDVII